MITAGDITTALRELGLGEGDAVFVHAGMRRALTVAGRGRAEKFETILGGVSDAVGEGSVMMPAFSYSFTKGEDFDLAITPSVGVGVLAEYFRALEGVRRTIDPLFSAAIRGPVAEGWEERLFTIRDVDCFGEGSIFDYLRAVNAKLLFFGVPATANTFVHYVEQLLGVPYRYFKDFRGRVKDESTARDVTARFYVRALDQDVDTYLAPLGDDLLRAARARARALPGGPSLYLTDAASVVRQCREGVAANPDYLIDRGHPGAEHLYPLLAP
jgi:aminoglycoside 3-N-acetyltransferase